MKNIWLITLISIALGITSCSKDDNKETTVYTVTFDTDGGDPVPAIQKIKSGSTVTAPATNPTKTGYAFMYWYLKGASSAYNFQSPVNNDITLFARWQDETTVEYWQVSWNLNEGSWPSDDNHATQVVKGGTLAEPAAPTKSSYTFDGWYKESVLTNKVTFPYNVNNLTENFTLYARWITETDPGDPDEPHKTDNDLRLAGYYLAYTINITEQYKKGLKPSYIENEEGETIVRVNYNPNGTMDYLYFYLYVYKVIYYYDRPMLTFRAGDIDYGRQALSALMNNTYNYDNDPGIIMSYFGSFSGSSVFTSLSNLRALANNDGITEEVYKKIAFPDGSYKLIVFVRKNEKTFGKYVGYSTSTGKSFRYWCIDPDDPSFGKSFTMSIPFDI
ncbi:MAG: InlB B-repeat-containing protein [Bacteroidales bacterium]|jgi:uncharacterized repeat protein (TIGR02543 family)|nr:InlB B-repeat-containing protein [Bacteroidales bacterium]